MHKITTHGNFHSYSDLSCDIDHTNPQVTYSRLLPMGTEDQICERYEAELAIIAALDRHYYLTSSATLAQRSDYAARQDQLEEIRRRFYAELKACRERYGFRQFRRCRSFMSRAARRSPVRYS